MGKSLQDQFLKLGLVNKKKADKAKKQQHLHKKKASVDTEIEVSKDRAKKRQKEKKDYSSMLNEQRAAEQQKNERHNRIKQLIEEHHLKEIEGDVEYKFTYQNKIRKLFLKKDLVEKLSAGKLAVVQQRDNFYLVPQEVGKKVGELETSALVFLYQKNKATSTEDDPYADFAVPDDLVW